MTDLMNKVWSAYWEGESGTDKALARVVEVVKQDCGSQVDAEIVAAAYRSFAAQIERGAEIDLEAAFTAGFRTGIAASSPSMQSLDIGIYGKAMDEPGKRRAYTYEHQPHNGPAYAIGCALHEAKHAPAGDEIDVGLALLKSLGKRGFGVFEMAPKGVAP